MPLRCFIACAFGYQDVDRIYDKTISVALRSMGIVPVRVDRIEHNDDIDNRILDELNKCDMCIADITYARPSVYFEAGYVIGHSRPVIFTCRADHFHARPDDSFGNLRVHFDLQMKNIIPWTEQDRSFESKLMRRIIYVTRPLILKLNKLQQTKSIQEEFASMSDTEKFDKMLSHAANILRRSRFTVPTSRFGWLSTGYLQASRSEKNMNRFVIIELSSSTTKKQLEQYHRFFGHTRGIDLLETVDSSTSKPRSVHAFCGSLGPIPVRRVAEALPYFVPNLEAKRFTHSAWGFDDKKEITDVHLLDNITSINDFVDEFKAHLRLVLQEHFEISDTKRQSIGKSRRKK